MTLEGVQEIYDESPTLLQEYLDREIPHYAWHINSHLSRNNAGDPFRAEFRTLGDQMVAMGLAEQVWITQGKRKFDNYNFTGKFTAFQIAIRGYAEEQRRIN
ncbi:hypothetical protein AB4562_06825 [Vibrio sp. 10N.222.54.A1]